MLVVIGSIGYSILIRRAYKYLQHARDTRDVLFQHFRGLTDGIKELKLHAGRREAFLSERIETATEALRRDALLGSGITQLQIRFLNYFSMVSLAGRFSQLLLFRTSAPRRGRVTSWPCSTL